MSLKEELLQDMKAAMKAKEAGKTALSFIRMVRSAVAGQSGLKMGDVMKLVMPKVKGKANGKLVSQIVREILQNN